MGRRSGHVLRHGYCPAPRTQPRQGGALVASMRVASGGLLDRGSGVSLLCGGGTSAPGELRGDGDCSGGADEEVDQRADSRCGLKGANETTCAVRFK